MGKLNECVVLELNTYAKAHPNFSPDALTRAQQIWTALCSTSIEESVSQYFALQQQEAAGHVKDLESALEQIMVEEWGMQVALGRAGRPEELGDVIAFLLSERASYLTGATVNVDGGTDF